MSLSLISLPADIIAKVCQSYLGLQDLVRLDSAVCTKALRNVLLASQANICVSNSHCGRAEWWNTCLAWLDIRGMSIRDLLVEWIDVGGFELLQFSRTLHSVRTLHLQDIDVWPASWWPSFIALCPNLEEFRLKTEQSVFEPLTAVASSCPKLRVVSLAANDPQADTASHLTKIVNSCPDLCEVSLDNCHLSDYQPLVDKNVSLLAHTYYRTNYLLMQDAGVFEYEIILYRSPKYYGPSAYFMLARRPPLRKVAEVINLQLEMQPEFIIHMSSDVYKAHFASLRVYLHDLVWIEIANCEDWTIDDLVTVLQLRRVRAMNLEGNHTITSLPTKLKIGRNLKGLSLKRFTTITTSALVGLVKTNTKLTVEACKMSQISSRAHKRISVIF